jgi:CRP-like cAMP-binding protein
MITPEAVDRLAKHLVALHPYPGAAHAALEGVIARGHSQRIPAGSTLCTEGEPGESMWFLVRGRVKIERNDPNGRQRVLMNVDCPSLIGHMALIDGSRRSATCIADGDVEVIELSAQAFEKLLMETTASGTALRRLLLSSLNGQLVSANARMRAVEATVTGEHRAAAPSRPTPKPTPKPAPKPAPPATLTREDTEDSMMGIMAQLGGWDSDLTELQEMEKDITFVVDEDQKRRTDKRGRK